MTDMESVSDNPALRGAAFNGAMKQNTNLSSSVIQRLSDSGDYHVV